MWRSAPTALRLGTLSLFLGYVGLFLSFVLAELAGSLISSATASIEKVPEASFILNSQAQAVLEAEGLVLRTTMGLIVLAVPLVLVGLRRYRRIRSDQDFNASFETLLSDLSQVRTEYHARRLALQSINEKRRRAEELASLTKEQAAAVEAAFGKVASRGSKVNISLAVLGIVLSLAFGIVGIVVAM